MHIAAILGGILCVRERGRQREIDSGMYDHEELVILIICCKADLRVVSERVTGMVCC